MSYETRGEMKMELTEIAVTRRQLSDSIVKSLLSNFTSKEIVLIAQAVNIGDYYRLIELIKR